MACHSLRQVVAEALRNLCSDKARAKDDEHYDGDDGDAVDDAAAAVVAVTARGMPQKSIQNSKWQAQNCFNIHNARR